MRMWRGRRCQAAGSRRGATVLVGAVLVGALGLSGCAKTTTIAASRKEPFKLDKVEGTERKRIRLEVKAAERLGVQTVAVTEAPASAGGPPRTTVPYGALLYDTKGGVSVYTVPEPLLYIREPVKVQSIDGDVVVLAEGPPPGMAVVTAGGSELTGIEFGVGK
jgi:hypothetical protein